MPLYQINPAQLPQVWPVVAPMLQRAIDLDPELITSEQVEYAVRTGRTFLLVWDEPDEGITGAVTVDIIDYPRERVAHVNLMGATTAQCWAKGTLVQMYEKMGMTNTHQVMREKL